MPASTSTVRSMSLPPLPPTANLGSEASSSTITPTATVMKTIMEDTSKLVGPSSVPTSRSPEITGSKHHNISIHSHSHSHKHQGIASQFTTPDNLQRSGTQTQQISDAGVNPSFAQSVTPSSVVTLKVKVNAKVNVNANAKVNVNANANATRKSQSIIHSSITSASAGIANTNTGNPTSQSRDGSKAIAAHNHASATTAQSETQAKTALGHNSSSNSNNMVRNNGASLRLESSSSVTTPPAEASRTEQSKPNSAVAAASWTRAATPVPLSSTAAAAGEGGNSNSNSNKGIIRTPVRSPKNSSNSGYGYTFNSDLQHFASPSIFLSPYVPSPPDALDKKQSIGHGNGHGNGGGRDREVKHSGIMSTNFASDFDKTEMNDDALNNVLPWLSPNAYGLFSPAGGLTKSITPSAIKNTHTNFSLPLEGSNRNRVPAPSGGGLMICVSPLARKGNGNGANLHDHGHGHARMNMKQPETPINFHEVFASPKSDYRSHQPYYQTSISNEIPLISESSKEQAKMLMVLEKSDSERSVKEDEDLNVLLDLAKTTPRNDTDVEGTRVFRGAGGAFAYPAGQPVGPPSFLHLPMIGKHANGTGTENGSGTVERRRHPSIKKKIASSPKKRKIPGQPPKIKHPLPGEIINHPPQGYYPPPYMHPASAAAAAGRTPFPYSYPSSNGQGPAPYVYPKTALPAGTATVKGLKKKSIPKTSKPTTSSSSNSNSNSSSISSLKRPSVSVTTTNKKAKKQSTKAIAKGRGPGKRKAVASSSGADKQKSAAAISAINNASGKKNNKAASLAAAVLRGVTMRPSGKWQAQLYFAGKSRYIGVFDSREKAALAYEIAREHLQNKNAQGSKDTESHVNAARKAAFEGVNEKDPRIGS